MSSPDSDISANWLAGRISDRSIRGITRHACDLIRSGDVPLGAQLPPVRDLAFALGVSPATVSAAWSELRRLNLVEGRGRNGMHVCGRSASPHPSRFRSTGYFIEGALDLTLAVPDPQFLPSFGAALREASQVVGLNQYARVAIVDRLRQAVEPGWPYKAQGFLATDGGYHGVLVTLQALLLPGSRVAVEMPTALRLLDILEHVGAVPVPVACDDKGPTPEGLATALAQQPAAFLFQPRTHSITGHVVPPTRLADLAALLEPTDVAIVEDDGIAELSIAPPQSLGAWLPDRVVHIRSLSKTLGPDLRLAIVSATPDVVAKIQGYRAFGSGWSSRLLQETAALLLEDPATSAAVTRARDAYRHRRERLLSALAERGRLLPNRDGLCLWVPVRDESFALVTCASHNLAVMPGSKCSTLEMSPHIRVATSLLADRYDEVADVLARLHPTARIDTLAAGSG
jgi:DNA-binding transcriptional MocR family regulator